MEAAKKELKTCFVIMPISDIDTYPVGHFKRVYEHLIKPACSLAGFEAIRADDIQTTNYIALDIVKQILNCDMAVCDLSSRNPNVLYELGIRQAFNKPVSLIKDLKTTRVFDISGFRDIAYDESLRIDTVEIGIESLATTIKNTYENHEKEINSLIKLLGIEPARIEEQIKISPDTEVLVNLISGLSKDITELWSRLPQTYEPQQKTSMPASNVFSADVVNEIGLQVGDKIDHNKFGICMVKALEGTNHNPVATIVLMSGEKKKIMLNYGRFKKL